MQLQRRFCGIAGALIAMAALGVTDAKAQPIAMERVTGDDGRFTIDMPVGYTDKTSPRPDGGTMRQLSYLWKDAIGQYNAIALAIIDPPPGTTKYIDMWEAQRVARARYPGSIFAQSQEIQSGSTKGMSFTMTVDAKRNQGVHVIAMKIYELNGRLYEMLAETRIEDRDDPTVVAFMNSLRIIR